jgi:hypothetical protein
MSAANRPPTALEASAPLRLLALPAYRRHAVQRLAESFCDVPDDVLGIPVKPLTPATFTMLLATGSRFVVGKEAPAEGDVRNFIWFHSPLFAHAGQPFSKLRKWIALRRLQWKLTHPWRRWLGMRPSAHLYSLTLAHAIEEIEQLVEQAFAFMATGGGKADPVPLATLEASLVHRFASAYGWPAEQTRQTPLRQLFQLDRCILRSRGEDIKDQGYEAILEAHLRQRLALLQPPSPSVP